MNITVANEISIKLNSVIPKNMMKRVALNAFRALQEAQKRASIIGGIDTAAREAIEMTSSLKPLQRRFTPKKPK